MTHVTAAPPDCLARGQRQAEAAGDAPGLAGLRADAAGWRGAGYPVVIELTPASRGGGSRSRAKSAAGSGRLKRKPCTLSQPSSRR